jgi:hypothetical protein
MVEEPQPAAGDVRYQAIENHPRRLLGRRAIVRRAGAGRLGSVEPVVQQHPQATAALRHAEADGPPGCRTPVGQPEQMVFARFELQVRHQVANPRQAATLHQRILRLVDQLINVAGAQAAGDHALHQRQLAALAVVLDPPGL